MEGYCEYESHQETLQDTFRNTPGCIFPCFSARKHTWGKFCTPICTPLCHCHKNDAPSGRAHPHVYTVQVWSKSDRWFLRYRHFCILPPCFSYSNHYQHLITSTWDMASDPMPQQLITQSAQSTTDAIASVLTARTASISLPIYNWNSQDAYHSFSIFCCTLENWLLLNCILPDSKDYHRYVFAALGTNSLEMHAQ